MLQEKAILQPICQHNVLTKTVHSTLAKSNANCATQPSESKSVVGLARALVNDCTENVQLRVKLEESTSLGPLEQDEQVELNISKQTDILLI